MVTGKAPGEAESAANKRDPVEMRTGRQSRRKFIAGAGADGEAGHEVRPRKSEAGREVGDDVSWTAEDQVTVRTGFAVIIRLEDMVHVDRKRDALARVIARARQAAESLFDFDYSLPAHPRGLAL